MHRKSTTEAAKLIAEAYTGRIDFVARNSEPGAQAYITRDGDLVIPGTNEPTDWLTFNLPVYLQEGASIPGLKLVPVADMKNWHFGFLRHADSVFRFAQNFRPRFIVGHSLGGAAAQIIGYRLKCPTITFGSPRVYMGGRKLLDGEGWVLNICRADDPVTRIPMLNGFRHLGSVRSLRTGLRPSAHNHPIVEYLGLIQDEDDRRFASVEREWPRVA